MHLMIKCRGILLGFSVQDNQKDMIDHMVSLWYYFEQINL